MDRSSQIAWKLVPLRHFFPLKVVPLIELLLYLKLQSVVQQAKVLRSRPDPLTCWTYSLSGQAKASMEIAPSPRKPLTCWIYSLSGRSLVGLPTVLGVSFLSTFRKICNEVFATQFTPRKQFILVISWCFPKAVRVSEHKLHLKASIS
jgi:hypothetical protein